MADGSLGIVTEVRRRSLLAGIMRRLVKEKPLGVVCGIITLLLLLIAVFADFLAPYGMNETNMLVRLQPPSAQYLLGTDNLGRDIFSRVVYGARVSVIVGLAATTLSTVISLIIGIVSGYIGGILDLAVQRVVDTFLCVPTLIALMVAVSIIGVGIWQMTLALGVVVGIRGVRLIRSAVISIQENAYLGAASAIGCSTPRILFRHILPNIMAPTIILYSTRLPAVILAEASLSFLGFGIRLPTPTWGNMLSGPARVYMLQAPWMAIWPGLALALVVYSVNMFGDALRDILDPRLKEYYSGN